jgi:DNA mismatch repair protein MutS
MAKAATDTPMMRQYLEAKAAHPDAVLLMRMGDFYEAFMGDAEELARHAGVALTCRNKDADDPIAMAGVPHHSLPTYLPRLLAAGKRVAIMDQLEDPKSAKGLVKRGLTRVITAGTLIDESALDAQAANHLVALTALDPATGDIGVAALDTSTGRFTVEAAPDRQRLSLILARLSPAEIVVPDELRRREDTLSTLSDLCAPVPVPPVAGLAAYAWKPADARRWLAERLGVATLDGFGIGATDDHLAAAAAAALRYADAAANPGGTGKALGHVRRLTRLHHDDHLVIDATCRRNLELLRNSRDHSRQGSLLAAIDRTKSAAGARLLAEWLARPLTALAPIQARHDAVASLITDDRRRDDLRTALAEVYDLERLLARVATGRCHGRDLVHLATTMRAAAAVATALRRGGSALPSLLELAVEQLAPAPELMAAIGSTLVDDPPLTISDGGLVRDGVDAELDRLRAIRRDAGEWLAQYQAREAAACGLKQIKVGYNKVFGYYIELSRAHGDKVPPHFVRKQTLVGAERYITPELKDYEDQALGAEERINALELAHFTRLRDHAEQSLDALQACAHGLALIDVLAGLADVARKLGWARPVMDDSLLLDLRESRHPVVEDVLGRGRFVANDCMLDAGQSGSPTVSEDSRKSGSRPEVHETSGLPDFRTSGPRLAVITGPNMAGKSTYIRQVALAVILAQAGSFVPATTARIGVVDRVFTRVGAGDELARGQSTFMVEMAETAAILNHATLRSLVVLDEVGRGTSTYDGVSLAWAITEHIHDRIGCRALFATHYHELVDLAFDRPGICNLTVSVAEQDDTVVFLHRIVAGAATRSYGIHVARLAGVPESVIARARAVLGTLEQLNVDLTERERPTARDQHQPAVQLTLFSPSDSALTKRLKELELDGLSPRQALEMLYDLQRQARL